MVSGVLPPSVIILYVSFRMPGCQGFRNEGLGQSARQTGRQTDRQTGRQTDRQRGRQIDRRADRQTDREADIQTDR